METDRRQLMAPAKTASYLRAGQRMVLLGLGGVGSSRVLGQLLRSMYSAGTWTDSGSDLQIGPSRFTAKTDLSGRHFLEDTSGRRYTSGIDRRLLRTSEDSAGSVLHPVVPIERRAGVKDDDDVRVRQPRAADGVGRLVQRAAANLNRQIQRSSEPLTFASLWRRLIRAAVSILRQLLRMQRRRHAETPEAVTHSHAVDQHRTRGPNPARTTSPFMVLREPARV